MIDIKEDLEPRIKYVVDEIAEMKIKPTRQERRAQKKSK